MSQFRLRPYAGEVQAVLWTALAMQSSTASRVDTPADCQRAQPLGWVPTYPCTVAASFGASRQ